MEISGRPLRKHKLLADVTDISNLENFQPPKNLVFLESLNILANVRYVRSSGGHFKTQSVDDVIYTGNKLEGDWGEIVALGAEISP